MPEAAKDAARLPDAPLLDACERSTAAAASVRAAFVEMKQAHERMRSR
jgi:hypothetical protein